MSSVIRAEVSYLNGVSAKCRVATKIKIFQNEKLVAYAAFGGRYSQNQAVREYLSNPRRFTLAVVPAKMAIAA